LISYRVRVAASLILKQRQVLKRRQAGAAA
jgi:hypothetical protein